MAVQRNELFCMNERVGSFIHDIEALFKILNINNLQNTHP